MEVVKAWDYAQRTFRSEKLLIAYIKAEIGTGKHRFWCFEDDCMVMLNVFICSIYILYVCII